MVVKLDKIDKKILNQLDLNSRQPDAEIGKKIRVSKQVVNYRIKKLVERGIITRFFSEVNIVKLGFSVYKIYIQLQSIDEEKEKELWDFLIKHPNIPWVIATSGRCDVIFGIIAKDVSEFDKVLEDVTDKYSNYIANREITIFNKATLHNRRWILDEGVKYSTLGGNAEKIKLDKKDLTLLKLISNNARIPIIELARELRLTSGAVLYKLKKLKDKIIDRFTIGIDLKKLEMEYCKAFVYYQNKTSKKEKELLDYCRNLKNIHGVSQSIGSWDLELEFEVKNYEEFYNIMKRIKNKFNLIRKFESVYISKEYGIEYMKGVEI